MSNLKKSIKKIYQGEKPLFWSMFVLILFSFSLLLFSLVTLKPEASVVKIGYGDIGGYSGGEWSSMSNSGGYQDGSWTNMLVFPILAAVLGVLHPLLAIKIYHKRGVGVAQIFVIVSIALVGATWLVLQRLLGEG